MKTDSSLAKQWHYTSKVQLSPPAFNLISIAPMMKHSTPQMRYLWRQLCHSCLLYTEMQPATALLRRPQKFRFSSSEKPLALQVAGHIPSMLAECAYRASLARYDEINLNLGCPSQRASDGNFGACLMKDIPLAVSCVRAMAQASNIPVSVKIRSGVDELDSLEYLVSVTEDLVEAGASKIIVHARKALLEGLNPKQNRTIPPLCPERVYALKQRVPEATIILNGGLRSLHAVRLALRQTDGVMLGRIAYENPMFLLEVAQEFYADSMPITRRQLLQKALAYARQRWEQGEPFRYTGRHLLSLYQGMPGARTYRRRLTSLMHMQKSPPSLEDVLPFLPNESISALVST